MSGGWPLLYTLSDCRQLVSCIAIYPASDLTLSPKVLAQTYILDGNPSRWIVFLLTNPNPLLTALQLSLLDPIPRTRQATKHQLPTSTATSKERNKRKHTNRHIVPNSARTNNEAKLHTQRTHHPHLTLLRTVHLSQDNRQ